MLSMKRLACLVLLVLAAACSEQPSTPEDDGGTDSSEDGGNPANASFAISSVTGTGDLLDLDMAVASDGRVGIAYFVNVGAPSGSSITDYELRYQEWSGGQVSQPEKVRVVQRMYGLDLAFQPNGQPAIAFLGGDNVTPDGTSDFWLQSDAAITRRSASGTWTEEVVAKNGDEAIAGNNVSDRGPVVGLDPALAFTADGTFFAWRDVHDGQFPEQDWAGSDLEIGIGGQGAWQKSVVIAGGKDKQAYGADLQMVIANGQPAIVSDQGFGGPDAAGQNVLFSRRNADGTWATPVRPIDSIANTQTGPSLAYDPTLGFAIAVVDKGQDALYFTRSVNDGKTWSEKDPVYQSGSGGWYPSLSINPDSHDPSIAFYICARAGGKQEGSCPERDDRLVVSERIGGIWRETTVDENGGWHPKLGHLPDGKRVVVYRDPRSGAINLAVEK